MEEKYAIVKIKDELQNPIYQFVNMDFVTPVDAYSYREQNYEDVENYIIVRYFK
jgi:hypothetical protein